MKEKDIPRALCALLAAAYLLTLRAYYVGFFNDDAFYIIGARSLLQGRYVELSTPGNPPMIDYMPGLPVLLAPLVGLFPGSFLPCQLLSVALTLGAMALFWRWLSQEVSPDARTAALVLAGLSPLTVSLSGTVLSDIPYLFMTPLILLAARARWQSAGARHWALLSALSAFAFYVRPTGAAFPVALVGALLLEKRWRPAALCAALCLVLCAPFPVRNVLAGRPPILHAHNLAAPYRQDAWPRLAGMAARNSLYYARETLLRATFRWPSVPGIGFLEASTLAAGTLLILTGARRLLNARKNKLLLIYIALYIPAHLAWNNQSGRYLLPILPLALACLFEGVSLLALRLGGNPRAAIGGTLSVALLLCLRPLGSIFAASLARGTPLNTPPLRTFGWIREHTRETDVIAAELDGRLHLLTGRPTFHLPKLRNPPEFEAWARERGVRYVLMFPTDFVMKTFAGDSAHDPLPVSVLGRLLSDPAAFEPVFSDPAEGSALYRAKERRPRPKGRGRLFPTN